jgi:hypothetical protein
VDDGGNDENIRSEIKRERGASLRGGDGDQCGGRNAIQRSWASVFTAREEWKTKVKVTEGDKARGSGRKRI